MPRLAGDYKLFEDFVARMFRAHGIECEAEVRLGNRQVADLMLSLPSGRRVLVEAKFYGSTVAETNSLRRALLQLANLEEAADVNGALLIVSTRLTSYQRNEKRSRLDGALIFDLEEIFYWSLIDDELFDEYYSFMLAIAFDSEQSQLEIHRAAKSARDRAERLQPSPALLLDSLASATMVGRNREAVPVQDKGSHLCAALSELDPGRPDAHAFERIAIDIIRYLFGRNLSRLEPQATLDNGLRIDLCAKILPRDYFWKDLVRDFNCRYIVFEFKNYKDKISQEQVYATEKYLLRDALRTIAIVMSREGPDTGADIASKGALREGGKVIVHLNLDDVCAMLREKDSGGTAEQLLEERFDKLLMTLAR